MLNSDYKEMLQILLEEGVRFIIVGAYALAVHGYPRATGDIDIWIKPDADNAHRVMRSLKRFGTPLYSLSENDFIAQGTVFQIGVVPRRIDIITSITGVGFDDAWNDCLKVEIDGLVIPVLSKEKLITNKEATGRDKDAIDVKNLRKRNT
jgi:predicted nucleotidyltransferase